MIFTKEPANVFYVLVSAFRSNLIDDDYEANMSHHRHMVSELRAAPGIYGELESTDLTTSGCYPGESIALAPTTTTYEEKKTMRVLCKNKEQVLQVARLACNDYEQDCVLVYNPQTHTAGLVYAKGIDDDDGYKAERLPGSFQEVPRTTSEEEELKGCFTIDEFGRRWQVR